MADILSVEPGSRLALTVDGPGAGATGPSGDNLVLRAARSLLARRSGLRAGAFRLWKRLPAAAGIGGGSSDAAAALRLLARLNGLGLREPDLLAAARETGADVPVCLEPQARMMLGAGETIGPPLGLPPLVGVLVNPGVSIPTPSVFKALGLAPGGRARGASHPPVAPREIGRGDPPDVVAMLSGCRNDLEPPALALAPEIGTALAALRAAPGCRLARMSGSGATVFGLFQDRQAAVAAARAVRHRHPGWWIRPTILR